MIEIADRYKIIVERRRYNMTKQTSYVGLTRIFIFMAVIFPNCLMHLRALYRAKSGSIKQKEIQKHKNTLKQ